MTNEEKFIIESLGNVSQSSASRSTSIAHKMFQSRLLQLPQPTPSMKHSWTRLPTTPCWTMQTSMPVSQNNTKRK